MALGVRILGSREPLRHVCAARTIAIERRDRTNPHTSEYVRPHLVASLEERRRIAAVASFPCRPSTENTRGVKWRRRSWQSCPYFAFFSFSCRARILWGSWPRFDGASVSVMRTSKTPVMPRFQNPWTATSPRSSGGVSAVAGVSTPSLSGPDRIKGSSETFEGVKACEQRWFHSSFTSL
jgi:hypothetical protein